MPVTPSSSLSSSALNYLESLERNSKALRGNTGASTTTTAGGGGIKTNAKRRDSLSEIISNQRQRASLSKTDSEDYDFLNESLKSSNLGDEDLSSDSSSTESSEGRILPLGTPGNQVGRKSLKDIRELRNSIDQSLIKPLEGMNSRGRDEAKKKSQFESIKEEIPEEIPPKPAQIPSKSPFKKAIESGSESSDDDSIVFDELFEDVTESPPRRRDSVPVAVQKTSPAKIQRQKTPVLTSSEESSSSSSSSSSTSESTESSDSSDSESEATSSKASSKSSRKYGNDFESSESSSSESSTSTIKSEKPVPYDDFIPKLTSPESEKSTVRENSGKFEGMREEEKKKKEEERERKEEEKRKEQEEKRKKEEEKKRKEKEKERKKEEKRKKEEEKRRKEEDKERKRKEKERKKKEKRKKEEEKEKREATSSGASTSMSSLSSLPTSSEEPRRRRKRIEGRRRRGSPTCQTNVHHLIESVISSHLEMLNDFSEMEYRAVSEWTEELKRMNRHTGPTADRLRDIIQRRINRNF